MPADKEQEQEQKVDDHDHEHQHCLFEQELSKLFNAALEKGLSVGCAAQELLGLAAYIALENEVDREGFIEMCEHIFDIAASEHSANSTN